MLKTITFNDIYDAPAISLLEGHHTLEVFNEAFRNEGWEIEEWPEDYLSHEYWVPDGMGNWYSSHKEDPKAKPVTIVAWDGPKEMELFGPDTTIH